MQAEARSCFQYLQQEPQGTLQVDVTAVGGESKDGSTRQKLIQERD